MPLPLRDPSGVQSYVQAITRHYTKQIEHKVPSNRGPAGVVVHRKEF